MKGDTLVRPILVAVGALAMIWGIVEFPAFWRSQPFDAVAQDVVGRIPYSASALGELLPVIDRIEAEPGCEPRALHGAAVVLLRMMEDGFAPDELSRLDDRINAADRAARHSLACAPADPFLWIVLFSIESERNGFRPAYLDYIRQSYRLGPHEAWIAVRRNRVVLAIYPLLPPEIAEMAVQEFAELVQNRLYDVTVDTLLGPGWAIREQLLARLQTVDEPQRVDFASRLRERGVELAIPGVAPGGSRPWR